MRRSNRLSLTLTVLVAAALACNLPQAAPAIDPNAAFTAAAETVAAQLTQVAQTQNAPTNTSIAPPPPPQMTTTATNTSIPPTLAPPPTLPPTSTQICDAAAFILDVTVTDGTTFTPGTPFVKTWRLKNTGTCSWTPSYTIVFDHGDQMSGPSVQALVGNVNPGQTVDISVNLVAPSSDGTYKGFWKLRNSSGVTFTQFYADIKVAGGGSSLFAVTGVSYTLSTWSDAGHVNCPRIIAHITVNQAGTVTFQWTRKDPGSEPLQTLVFAAAGTKNVHYDWARGSTWAGTATWVGIYVNDPNHQDFGHLNFTTACTSP